MVAQTPQYPAGLNKLMDVQTITLLVFGAVILVALVLDLGLLSKKDEVLSFRKAIWQTVFWVLLSVGFCVFVWYEMGRESAIQYMSAYLLEWSLSIDNIFVFIILFSFFKVEPKNYARILLWGILMAIVFRILFIAVGSELVQRFDWIMYVFGAFLLFTGFKLLMSKEEEDFNPEDNWAFHAIHKLLPTTREEHNGRFFLRINGKLLFTSMSLVVVMLGLIDIVFAIDSIPAVFSVIRNPDDKLLIYSSNIFAVLGLRSLFFLLQGASDRFRYLKHGIAIVLLFIGAKMLLEHWVHIPVWASLMVIVVCITAAILYSVYKVEETENQ
jgi:tellurite resistance protein TerC